jgi:hypothetical protein
MKNTNKQEKIEAENYTVSQMAEGGQTDALLAMMFYRQGDILRQLQELQANSWLR